MHMLGLRIAAATVVLGVAAGAEKSAVSRTCGNEGGASSSICSLPPWPATWQMNASTIIMPCNYTGYQVPSTIAGWGIVDFECVLDCQRSFLGHMPTLTVWPSPSAPGGTG
jgi:hypothetical protein